MWSTPRWPKKVFQMSPGETFSPSNSPHPFFRFFSPLGTAWSNPRLLHAPRAAGVAPPTMPPKSVPNESRRFVFTIKFVPPFFWCFLPLGTARSTPRVLHAPKASGAVPPTMAQKNVPNESRRFVFTIKFAPPIFQVFLAPGDGLVESSCFACSESLRCGPPHDGPKKCSK